MPADRRPHLDTAAVHAGEPRPRILGAVSMPVFQSANFEYARETSAGDLKYIRLNNTPNHELLHRKLAALEGGEAALVMASGMAAISTALLAVLGAGDHLLAQECLYGGTYGLLRDELPALGIEVDFIDPARPETWGEKLRPKTRAIYVETLSNPLLEVPDLEAVVALARAHSLVSLIDNTFASPVNFRPPEHGFDLSLHSGTKYLNGHSDIVAGAVIGRADLVERALLRLNHLGGSLDPHSCQLLNRGIKTLGLRVRRQNETAEALSQFLAAHPAVARVHYAGLKSSASFSRARQYLEGCGGVLSFDMIGGLPAAERLLGALQLPLVAPSLGGVETLVTRPAITSHAGLDPAQRLALGIPDSLIRVAVGIEDPGDLLADFGQALERAGSPAPGA